MNLESLLPTLQINANDKKLLAILQYVAAILLPLVPLPLAFFVDPQAARSTPTLFFFPFIALSAWIGGYKTGIISSVVSAILIEYYFIPPYFTLLKPNTLAVMQVLLFAVEGSFISFLIDAGKRSSKLRDFKKEEAVLKERIASLEQINAASQKEIHSRDEFLSIASHELKTPLTSMLLQTQTALHSIRNVSLAHFSITNLLAMLESVENQTKRLSKMINDLLNVSLLATGNLQLEKETIDLKTIVQEVIVDFSSRLEKENYTLTYDPQESAIGYWDKLRIVQALSNLLSNAIKYGKHEPILIKTEKTNKFAKFVIKDSGIGINKQEQKRIFSLFERAVSPEDYKGLGVGLFITHQIIKAHGGAIIVSSKPGDGSTFIVELPLEHRKEPKTEQA